jgi:AcrR family transcriptional regulator
VALAPDPVDATVDDELRTRLLDAAIRVVARKGYDGARIRDIVREAGMSTGAVYGRWESKDELVREAIATRFRDAAGGAPDVDRVTDLIASRASKTDGPLSELEAAQLEIFVAARRDPDVADGLRAALAEFRRAVQPLVDAAVHDGTVADAFDPEAVLYFVQTISLGLRVQRAAGVPAPDPSSWQALVRQIVESFAAPTSTSTPGGKQ